MRQLFILGNGFLIIRLPFFGFVGGLKAQLHQRGLGHLFAQVSRLVEGPVVYFVGLRLLHGLHNIVVLDLANAHKGRQQRHGNRYCRVQA